MIIIIMLRLLLLLIIIIMILLILIIIAEHEVDVPALAVAVPALLDGRHAVERASLTGFVAISYPFSQFREQFTHTYLYPL